MLKGLTVLPINNEFMIIDDFFRYGKKSLTICDIISFSWMNSMFIRGG